MDVDVKRELRSKKLRVGARQNAASARPANSGSYVETVGCTRRVLLTAAVAGGAGFAGLALASPMSASDDAAHLIKQLTGRTATDSDRVQLIMPRQFPTGSPVPVTIVIDSPMTESDHVRQVRLLAPRNPIVDVARFNFTPGRSGARVSTRIRLAQPQHVVAVAEMSDGRLLMTKTWVDVATNGCT